MTYLCLAGTPKDNISPSKIEQLLALAGADSRVSLIRQTENPIMFYIECAELIGTYSFGRICNHLNELPSEIKARLQSESLPDIINITEFMNYGDRDQSAIRKLPKYTSKCLIEAISKCDPSHERAQLININSYTLHENETIAERFIRDHSSIAHARRQAQLLVAAGCANEINRKKSQYGTIIFEDGSQI